MLETVRRVAADLTPRGIPLIGFSGAPFTLASYAIEGGGSRGHERTKALMYREPAAWRRLMERLATVLGDVLVQQAKAGAAALQVFDSWAGALSPRDHARFVAPYTRQVIEAARRTGAPVIIFSTGTAGMLDQFVALGSQVIGVDWRVRLGAAWEQIGLERAIQGNLDPLVLMAPWREIKAQADEILAEAAGRPGHIFNLGHGILPQTPVDNVRRLADHIHLASTRAERVTA
jgi:uroporphyrinogen decarboxylase